LLVLFIGLAGLDIGRASSDIDQLEINASHIIFYSDLSILDATGAAVCAWGDRRLSANHLQIKLPEVLISGVGNATWGQPDENELAGDLICYDFPQARGQIVRLETAVTRWALPDLMPLTDQDEVCSAALISNKELNESLLAYEAGSAVWHLDGRLILQDVIPVIRGIPYPGLPRLTLRLIAQDIPIGWELRQLRVASGRGFSAGTGYGFQGPGPFRQLIRGEYGSHGLGERGVVEYQLRAGTDTHPLFEFRGRYTTTDETRALLETGRTGPNGELRLFADAVTILGASNLLVRMTGAALPAKDLSFSLDTTYLWQKMWKAFGESVYTLSPHLLFRSAVAFSAASEESGGSGGREYSGQFHAVWGDQWLRLDAGAAAIRQTLWDRQRLSPRLHVSWSSPSWGTSPLMFAIDNLTEAAWERGQFAGEVFTNDFKATVGTPRVSLSRSFEVQHNASFTYGYKDTGFAVASLRFSPGLSWVVNRRTRLLAMYSVEDNRHGSAPYPSSGTNSQSVTLSVVREADARISGAISANYDLSAAALKTGSVDATVAIGKKWRMTVDTTYDFSYGRWQRGEIALVREMGRMKFSAVADGTKEEFYLELVQRL